VSGNRPHRAMVLALLLFACVDGGRLDEASDVDPGESPAVPADTDYLVVAAPGFEEVAAEFVSYRRDTGYRAAAVSVTELVGDEVTYEGLVAEVHALLQRSRETLGELTPLFLLLLGDVPVGLPAEACANLLGDCFTDNGYADLDGDNIPEVAVGRVPAGHPDQARQLLSRLRDHESSYEPGVWNRRLVLYTGEGGFGDVIDLALEAAVMEGLALLDPSFDVIGAYNNPDSAYYYTPFEDKVVELVNAGSLAVIYIGHGGSTTQTGLSTAQLDAIRCQHRQPFALFFACLNGDYIGEQDSIAEALLKLDAGPIATFASSDLSHPYANGVLSYEVERAFFNSRPATIGEALREAKQQSMVNADSFRTRLDAATAFAGVFPPEQELIRRQHLDLYNLFGDPAAAMQYPRSRVLIAPVLRFGSGGSLRISGRAPGLNTGRALISLETERNVIHGELQETEPGQPDYEARVQANWATAIDKVIDAVEVQLANGRFDAWLELAPELDPTRTYNVKVYAWNEATDSFGAIKLNP